MNVIHFPNTLDLDLYSSSKNGWLKSSQTGKISFNRSVLSDTTKLTYETLLSILYALENTENPKKLILGKINLDKLTDNEKAIATEKNWTLS